MTLQLPIEQDKETGRYILRYDASLHSKSNCYMYVWNRLFLGLTTEHKDFKMEYGTAFHKALAHWYRGNHNPEQCIALAVAHYAPVTVPTSDWRSLAHLVNCLMQYFEHYGSGDTLVAGRIGTEYLVEKNFAYPFYRTDTTELLLCGTIDLKGECMNRHVICDHKTTSMSQNPTGYLAKADPSAQLLTYATINSLLFPTEPPIGVMLNGIFLNRTNKNVFQRSDLIEPTEWQLRHHKNALIGKAKEIISRFESVLASKPGEDPAELFPPNFTCCSAEYGMCEFVPMCRCLDADSRAAIASSNFVSKKYDPLQFQT